MFVDSDDYWVEDCLLECMKVSDGVDVVWFDSQIIHNNNFIYEGYNGSDNATSMERYVQGGLPSDTIITAMQWIDVASTHKLTFAFAWQGMIDFAFLRHKELMFFDNVQWEDVFFGIMLFSQVSKVYVLSKKLYCYCINPQSTSRYNKDIQKSDLPLCMQSLCDVFSSAYEAKEYYKFQGIVRAALAFGAFLQTHKYEPVMKQVKAYYFVGIVGWALGLLPAKDPWRVCEQFGILAPYIVDVNLGKLSAFKKLCITYPVFLPLLRGIMRCYNWIKCTLERCSFLARIWY